VYHLFYARFLFHFDSVILSYIDQLPFLLLTLLLSRPLLLLFIVLYYCQSFVWSLIYFLHFIHHTTLFAFLNTTGAFVVPSLLNKTYMDYATCER
jgi:hypothetical protein